MSPKSTYPSRSPAATRAPVAATPAAFVRAIALAYARVGRDATPALLDAGIDPGVLHTPSARLTSLPFERLAVRAMRELDDEALGWFARRLPWGSYGLLARASLTAPDLGLALARWCRHHALLTEDMRLILQRNGDAATLTVQEQRAPGSDLPGVADRATVREFAHVSLLRNALGLAAWLIDARLTLLELELAYPAPLHADAYTWLFPGARLRFDQPQTRVAFAAHVLREPLRRDDAALRAMLPHAVRLMVRPYRHDRLVVERARAWLRTHPGADAAALAQGLQVSLRTLQRQLAAAGTRLQALKDEVRRDLASELLQRTRWPVKRIAAQVGFDSDKSFLRAFRAWTGQTPTRFRRGAGKSHPGAGS
ncbi:AraC family transcriptional regulator [Tepidimonas sp.]|uniref:AraC family transcriptional regulator n=1 Tax=Tepidimonas sp. TaxID=2002775 RepID=UPI002FE300E9